MKHFIRNLQHDMRLTAEIGEKRRSSKSRRQTQHHSLSYANNFDRAFPFRTYEIQIWAPNIVYSKKKKTSLQKTAIEGNKDSKHEKCVLKGKETL